VRAQGKSLGAIWNQLVTFVKANPTDGPYTITIQVDNRGPTSGAFHDNFDAFLLANGGPMNASDFFKVRSRHTRACAFLVPLL